MSNYSSNGFFNDSDDDEQQPAQAQAAQEPPVSADDGALLKKPLSAVLGMPVEKYEKDAPCMPVVAPDGLADTTGLAKQPRRTSSESVPLPSTEGDEAARTLSFANDPAGGDTPRTSPPAAAPPLPSAAAQAASAPAAAASAANHHVGWLDALKPGPNARLAANLWTPPPESGHMIITGGARLEKSFKRNYKGCAQVHKHVAKTASLSSQGSRTVHSTVTCRRSATLTRAAGPIARSMSAGGLVFRHRSSSRLSARAVAARQVR